MVCLQNRPMDVHEAVRSRYADNDAPINNWRTPHELCEISWIRTGLWVTQLTDACARAHSEGASCNRRQVAELLREGAVQLFRCFDDTCAIGEKRRHASEA